MEILESLIFLMKTIMKFKNLQISKILNTNIQNFSNSFQGYVHIFEVLRSLKNNSQ